MLEVKMDIISRYTNSLGQRSLPDQRQAIDLKTHVSSRDSGCLIVLMIDENGLHIKFCLYTHALRLNLIPTRVYLVHNVLLLALHPNYERLL